MNDGWMLAIETSGRRAEIALGRPGAGPPVSRAVERTRRHNLALLPTIDAACRDAGIGPADVAAVAVSLGPGSFTGLRVGVAAAQMLGLALGGDLVGVPTIDALAANVPGRLADAHVAVCLNTKRGVTHAAVFRGGEAVRPAATRPLAELWAGEPRPVAALGEALGDAVPGDVERLDESLAAVRAETVHGLGAARWRHGETLPPARLLPVYGREPEAVRLWRERG